MLELLVSVNFRYAVEGGPAVDVDPRGEAEMSEAIVILELPKAADKAL